MNVRATLELLSERIKDIFPKSSDVTAKSNKERIVQKSIIDDIQRRFAEIYGIIQREIANEDLNLDYSDALIKYPERIKSILNLISVMALAIKTKLNINNTEKVFNQEYIRRIDIVCFECYKIGLILSGKADGNAYEIYSKGINTEFRYVDYKTGYQRILSPGDIRGKINIFSACTQEVQSGHLSLVTKAVEQLDQAVKIPHIDERAPLVFSFRPVGKESQKMLITECRNPPSLYQTTLNFVLKNRHLFFKRLMVLPEGIRERVPALDIDYTHKFCVAVKKIISGVSFTPSAKEKEYLDKLSAALMQKNPYNAVHPILVEIKEISAQAFLTEFGNHMKPIREAIIALMRQYNDDKKEHGQYFGNTP